MHAGLGRWLEQQQQPQRAVEGPSLQVVEAPGTGLQGHPLIVLWGARICASFGSLLVVLLVDCPRLPYVSPQGLPRDLTSAVRLDRECDNFVVRVAMSTS